MKLSPVILLTILLGLTRYQLSGQSNIDSLTEISIIDTVWNLKEVQERNEYVIKKTKDKRNLSILLYRKPEQTEKGYYWIKVIEDNGTNLVTHFNFFVYPVDLKIVYFDTVYNKELELKEWRKQMIKEK